MIRKMICSIIFYYGLISGYSQTCPEVVDFPTDSKWGGGDRQGSVLIGNTYGPGQGPGIYIVADGGYRLYLNGELLAYDNAAGRVQFIPMTFLPGDNALSVVGINGKDAPGVLVHIDELQQAHYSGSSWKVNAGPTDNTWKNKNYNHNSWSNATQLSAGSVTQTPGGLAFTGFPAGSSSRWIWSSNSNNSQVVLRYMLRIKPVGFGEATTGGEGGQIVRVSNVNDLIRECNSGGAKIILVAEGVYDLRNHRNQLVCVSGGNNVVTGNCNTGVTRTVQRWDRRVSISSDKTIIGVGKGASLRGASFSTSNGISNIIMRNLTIWDVNPHIIEAGDGISPNGSTNFWVDHCTFKWISDGNDVANGKKHSWSWCLYEGVNQYVASGNDHYAAALDYTEITYDHFYWLNCEGRDPKASQYNTVHILNNYHENNTYYAVGSGKYSEVYVEGTVFENVRIPLQAEENGKIYEINNRYIYSGRFQRDWRNTSSLRDAMYSPSSKYSYTVESLNTVAANVKTNAGAGGKWRRLPAYNDAAGLVSAGPAVTITSPTNGYLFNAQQSLAVNVTVTGGSGTSRVEFFLGNVKIGEDASAPYSFNLSGLTNCTYSLRAVAYDSRGIAGYSEPVLIKAGNDCNGVANGSAYTDDCGQCVGGNTGKTPCIIDCNGDANGTALIDDCGICSGGRTGVAACAGALQGEAFCEADGVTESRNAGFLDTAYVNFTNALDSYGKWNLISERSAAVNLGVRLANGGTMARGMAVSVNGIRQATLTGSVTGDWTNWIVENIRIELTEGVNELTLTSLTSDGGPNIDLFTYSESWIRSGSCIVDCHGHMGGEAYLDNCNMCVGGTTGKLACVQDCAGTWGGNAKEDACEVCLSTREYQACSGSLEAEEACDAHGIILEDRNAGFSGAGYVNTENELGAYADWMLRSLSQGKHTLTFRYASGGGDLSRDARILVDGNEVATLAFPPTGQWTTWVHATINLEFAEGDHVLRLEALTEGGLANLDILHFSEGLEALPCIITSLGSDAAPENISIYPNPTEGKVYLNHVYGPWRLTDALGVELHSGTGSGHIDIGTYSSGVYYLIIDAKVYKLLKK